MRAFILCQLSLVWIAHGGFLDDESTCLSIEAPNCFEVTPKTAFNCSEYSDAQLEGFKNDLYYAANTLYDLGYPQAKRNLRNFLLKHKPAIRVRSRVLEEQEDILLLAQSNKDNLILEQVLPLASEMADGSLRDAKCLCDGAKSTPLTSIGLSAADFRVGTNANICLRRAGDRVDFTIKFNHQFFDSYDFDGGYEYASILFDEASPLYDDPYMVEKAVYCLEESGKAEGFIQTSSWSERVCGYIDLSADCESYVVTDTCVVGCEPPYLFVVDDTGSMGNDIAAVKNIMTGLLNRVKDTEKEPYLYVSSPFNDPMSSAGDFTVTPRSDTFQSAINALRASGGADCPEYAMTGILNAIRYANRRSTVFFFTDADAKDSDLYPTALGQVLSKQTTFIGFVTGQCSSAAGIDEEYYELARKTGGFLVLSTHSGVNNVINIVSSFLRPDVAPIFVANTASEDWRALVWVDETLTRFIFAVASGKNGNPKFTLTAPNGEVYSTRSGVTNTNTFKIVLGTSTSSLTHVAILPRGRRHLGQWRVRVTSNLAVGEENTVKAYGPTPIDFAFSLQEDVDGTGVFEDVTGQPNRGAQVLRVIARPIGSDAGALGSVERIAVTTLDNERFIQRNAAMSPDGFYADFNLADIPYHEFRVAARGETAGKIKDTFKRVTNSVFTFTNINVRVTPSDSNIPVGSARTFSIRVSSSSDVGQTVQVTAVADISGVSMSLSQDSVSVSAGGAINLIGQATVASDSDLIGEQFQVTVTVNGDSTGAGEPENYDYSVTNFNIVAVNAGDEPTCSVTTDTFSTACSHAGLVAPSCENSSYTATVVGVSNSGYPLDYAYIGCEETAQENVVITPSVDSNTITVSFDSTCCGPSSEVYFVDTLGRVATCTVGSPGCDLGTIGQFQAGENVTVDCADINPLLEGNINSVCIGDNELEDFDNDCRYNEAILDSVVAFIFGEQGIPAPVYWIGATLFVAFAIGIYRYWKCQSKSKTLNERTSILSGVTTNYQTL